MGLGSLSNLSLGVQSGLFCDAPEHPYVHPPVWEDPWYCVSDSGHRVEANVVGANIFLQPHHFILAYVVVRVLLEEIGASTGPVPSCSFIVAGHGERSGDMKLPEQV